MCRTYRSRVHCVKVTFGSYEPPFSVLILREVAANFALQAISRSSTPLHSFCQRTRSVADCVSKDCCKNRWTWNSSFVTSMTYREYAEDISKSPNDHALITASGNAQIVSLHGSSPVFSGLDMFRFQAAPTVDDPSSTGPISATTKEVGRKMYPQSSNKLGSSLLG